MPDFKTTTLEFSVNGIATLCEARKRTTPFNAEMNRELLLAFDESKPHPDALHAAACAASIFPPAAD